MSEPLKTENKVAEQQHVDEKHVAEHREVNEKNDVQHIDNKIAPSLNEVDEKDGVQRDLDQFGAWAKSDPKEIALVKKLDLYIMVRKVLFATLQVYLLTLD